MRSIIDLVAAPGDWRAIALDRAEQFIGVVVEPESAPPTAFFVRPDGIGLERDRPAFTLSENWQEVLPDLAIEPAPEEWRQGWLTWCRAHGIDEAGTCEIVREGHRLLARAPNSLAERLRSEFGPEAWLLAGSGRFRLADRFEVTEI